MSSPLVSVCIGTYNRERYIGECLDSVFAQTYPNIEVIVVDDGSTDRTVEILRNYGARIRLIERTHNSGLPAVVRNTAIKHATGKYIAFIDSDDLWLERKLAVQVEMMEDNPQYGLVHGYCRIIDEEGRELQVRHESALPPGGNCFSALLRHCFITTSTVMVRRGVLEDVGYFSENPCYRIGEDFELFLRIAGKYEVGLINDVVALYRRAPSGMTQSDVEWKCRPRDVIRHLCVYRQRELWRGRVSARQVRRIFIEACLENAQYWRGRRRFYRSAWFPFYALRTAPFSLEVWKEFLKSSLRPFVKHVQMGGGRDQSPPDPGLMKNKDK